MMMKKNISKYIVACFSIILGFTIQSSFAQKGVSLGVLAGPQITNISDLPGEYQRTLHWNGAITAVYNFTARKGLELECRFSRQGQKTEYYLSQYYSTGSGFQDAKILSNLKFDYLKVPILFCYKSNTEKKFAFVGAIGPQFNYLLHGVLEYNDGKDKSIDATTFYNRFNFDIALKLALSFKLINNLELRSGLHFDHDLNSVSKDSNRHMYNFCDGFEIGVNYHL